MAGRASLSFVLVVIAGCSLSPFRDFESNTPTTTIASTSPFPSATFGSVLTSYRVSTAGHELSRIVVGTGPLAVGATMTDSILGAYTFWQDGRLDEGRKVYSICDGIDTVCPDDVGSSITPIRDLLGGHGCVLAGAPNSPTPEVLVSCESNAATTNNSIDRFTSPAATTALFGASVQAVPEVASVIGVAFVGAPGSNEVYVMADDASFAVLGFGGPTPTAMASFGGSLATAPIAPTDPAIEAMLPASDARSLLVVGAPGENRVYLYFARNRSAVGNDAVLLGCIDGPRAMPTIDDGFGTELAASDIDADGMPEIVIGASLSAAMRSDEVRIVSSTDVVNAGAGVGCADPSPADDPTTRVLACPTDPAGRVSCDGFGSAIAIGNADGTPERDLLVGAPLASVGDTSHAGAAFVFAGNASLDTFVSAANEPMRLVDSSPSVNDTLGLAVTFVPSQLVVTGESPRDEPVASAPGANRLFVFLCSGLAGDSLADGRARCIAEE